MVVVPRRALGQQQFASLQATTNSPRNKAMFRKRRPTDSGASGSYSDPTCRCERTQPLACSQLINGSVILSKEAENRRWREDAPRCRERVLRWGPFSQECPRRRERAHQTLRGICRVDGYCARLTRPQQFEDVRERIEDL